MQAPPQIKLSFKPSVVEVVVEAQAMSLVVVVEAAVEVAEQEASASSVGKPIILVVQAATQPSKALQQAIV